MKEIGGFERGVSSSNHPKYTGNPNSSSTGSGENNENDLIQEKLIPNFQKHFMSATISAASKAAAPRKKILIDSNENSGSFDSQIHKSSKFEPKRSSKISSMSHSDRSSQRVNLPRNDASESDGDPNFLADQSLNPYDPLTNYLTPRPKYMRFDPNRRCEVLNRLEIESGDDLYGCFEALKVSDGEESPSFSSTKDSLVKQVEKSTEVEGGNLSNDYEEDNLDEGKEEEDEEEVEEERGWCLRGLLKILLTVLACLFFTSYICSMNSTIHLPIQQQDICSLSDGYKMIQNLTFETDDSGFLAVEKGYRFLQLVEVEIDENDNFENKEGIAPELVEDEVNSEEFVKLLENKNEDNADKSGIVAETESAEIAQLIDVTTFGYEKGVEGLNRGSIMYDVVKTEAALNEVVGGDEVESEIEGFQQLIGAKTDEYEDFGVHGLDMEVEDAQEGELQKHIEVLDDIKSVEEENIIGSQEKMTESIIKVDEIGYQIEGEMAKSGYYYLIAVGVISVVSMIFASIFVFYRSNKARSKSASIQDQPVIEEEMTPPLPLAIEKKIEFFARPSLQPRMEEAPEELNHNINVPTVKLIGEIDMEELSSSSYLRSCGSKFQMIESEESSATSFYPKQSSPPQPFSSPMKISTTSSHSHGSFTTEMKFLKKEGGGRNGKAKIEVLTPVWRSSRLRNRDSVISSP